MFNLYADKMDGEMIGRRREPTIGIRQPQMASPTAIPMAEAAHNDSDIFDLARSIVNRANRRRRLRRSSNII